MFCVTDRQQYGCKSLITHARQFIQLADENPVNFERPTVCFLFNDKVPLALCESLQSLGVGVMTLAELSDCVSTTSGIKCNIGHWAGLTNSPDDGHSVVELNSTSSERYNLVANNESDNASAVDGLRQPCVNLDVTALVALVSNVSNGHCNYTFKDATLTQQAVEERTSPVLPGIQSFIADKRVYVCRTALTQFRSIIDLLGGPSERQRATLLLDTVSVVDDQPSVRSHQLKLSRRISGRAWTIFATGDHLKAVTVTANKSFVRAAAQTGFEFVTYLHQARALTEQKQATADIVEPH